MTKQGVESRHSDTALYAGLCRSVAAMEHPDESFGADYLARGFLPPHIRFFIRFDKIRSNFRNKDAQMTPGGYQYVLARTAFFDALFVNALAQQIPQIVLLGAGYDSRAYRFADQNKGSDIFELDISTTQDRKLKCLKKLGVEVPAQLKFASINFNKESIASALENVGYDSAKKTLFMWEGVTMYLEPSAVSATLDFVKGSAGADSAIAFDYVVSIPEDAYDAHYGVREFMETWAKHRKNEPFQFSLPEDELACYLKGAGLTLSSQMNSVQIEEAFLSDGLGSSDSRVSGLFRFAVASNAAC